MTTDQLLQEAIISLQKRDLCAETRHLVEEAAQLLAGGRDIEARALVEKAQAIAVTESRTKTNGAPEPDRPTAGDRTAQTIISRVSSRLAEGISTVLTEAVQELHVNFGAQINDVASSLEGRLAEITARLTVLPGLNHRVDRIEETDRSRQAEAERFSRNVAAALETVTSRVAAQEERLQAITSLVQDVSSKAVALAEQIDHQTRVVRSIQERQTQRAAALNAVLEGIAKLREPEVSGSAAAA